MSDYELCCITNRFLCPDDIVSRVETIITAGAGYLMLREKDLPHEDLLRLAMELSPAVTRHSVKFIINSNITVAEKVQAWGLQMPFETFKAHGCGDLRLKKFNVGVSIHSLDEAVEAERLGADRIVAGHIFPTTCKEGLPGRGLDFLRSLKRSLTIPIWAVGGIRPENKAQVIEAGASVICIMSSLMQCDSPALQTSLYLRPY